MKKEAEKHNQINNDTMEINRHMYENYDER